MSLSYGCLKGALIVVFAFSVLVLGFDTAWGYKGRPDWITQARSYPVVDAFSREMVWMIAERRARLMGTDEGEDDRGAAPDTGG